MSLAKQSCLSSRGRSHGGYEHRPSNKALSISLADRHWLTNLPGKIFSPCIKFGGSRRRGAETHHVQTDTHRHTDRQTDRQTDTHTHTHTHTHTQKAKSTAAACAITPPGYKSQGSCALRRIIGPALTNPPETGPVCTRRR